MDTSTIEKWARILDQATLDTREIDRITATEANLSLEDAYRIQDNGIRLRLARGEKPIGLKMGLTSKAKMEQMGLNSPIYGVLTDRMRIENGGKIALSRHIHPKIEPEIAFIIGKDLRGPVSAEQALGACSAICAAMEILDSRFLNFKYFSLEDVVADNCSSSAVVLGEPVDPSRFGLEELANLELVMSINDKPVQRALASAVLGSPVESLMRLCRLLDSRGQILKSGSIVLTGAATQAVPLVSGDQVKTSVAGLGETRISVIA